MTAYLKTWLALLGDRRAVTAFDKGVIAGVVALAMATEAAINLLSMN